MPRRFARLLLPLACLLAAAPGSASAGDGIFVNTADDVIAADSQCSLREAIINANNNDQSGSTDCFSGNLFGPDTIYFDASLAGATITLNGTALPVITEELSIVGPGKFDSDALTIDAGGTSRIFVAEGTVPSDFELRLANLTLTGGATTGIQEHGGAIFVSDADLNLSHARVLDSSTTGFQAWGGGIAVLAGNAVLNRVTVAGNSTGGNLSGGGGLTVNGALTLVESTVADNQTAGDNAIGGGVLAGGGASVLGSTLSGNATAGANAHGGGLMVLSGNSVVVNSTVSGNHVGGGGADGAGLYFDAGTLSLMHSTVAFNRNHSGGIGGVVKASANPSHQFGLFNSIVVQGGDGEIACNQVADIQTNSRATDASCTGSGNPLEDFSLLPLADNGGPAQTHAFFWPSAVLNQAGDCVNDYGIDTDQRLEPRPGAGSSACDMGAFELQGPIEAELQIAPAAVDFGQVPVGGTSPPVTVTLTGGGNALLEIQSITPAAAPFALTGGDCPEPPFDLNPGQSCTLEFIFTPDSVGTAGQVLEVASTDPNSPHTITLTGEGEFTGCVTDSAQLQNALTAAGGNGQDDVIKIAAGHYPAPPGGFVYNAQTPGGDDHDLTLIGGWTAAGNDPCGQLDDENPFHTVLDGENSDRVMHLRPRENSNVTVRLLTFRNGYSAGGGSGLTISSPTSDPYTGAVTIAGNAFVDNEAHSASGLWVEIQPSSDAARVSLVNNLIIDNHGSEDLGAGLVRVFPADSSAPGAGIFAINNTVAGNTAGSPGSGAFGGFQIAAPVGFARVVANNNLWGNQNADLVMFGSGGYELLHNNIGVLNGFDPGVDTGNLSIEPIYEPCTPPCAAWIPAAGSPLIDAGLHPDGAAGWSLTDFDLAGRPRVNGGQVDIGAYENHDRLFSDRFEPLQ